MKLLKPLFPEKFDYYSEKPANRLKADIQKLFSKTKAEYSGVNLKGKFTSEFEFTMTPKLQFITIKFFEKELSFLEGEIYSDEFKRTRVTFWVRANSIFFIFFFIFLIVGITILNNTSNDDGIRLGLFLTFVIPLLKLFVAHIAKQLIKDRFINTFDLKPIEDSVEEK